MDNNNLVNPVAANSNNNTVMNVVNDADAPTILNQNTEENVNEEDKKQSPLEALASKLAQLKSELVQEVPDQPKEESIPVEQVPENNITQEINSIQEDINNQVNSVIEDQQTIQTPEVSFDTNNPLDQSQSQPPVMNFDQLNSLASTPAIQQVPVMESPVVQDTPSTEVEAQNVVNIDTNTVDPLQQIMETPIAQVPEEQNTVNNELPTLDTPILNETPTVPAVAEVLPQPQDLANESVSVDDILAQYENVNNSTSEQVVENTQQTNEEESLTKTHQDYALDIRKILDIAIERDASDILISVGYPVMIRVDGALIAVHEQIVGPKNAEELIFPVLSEQKKELLEVNREVDLAYTHQHNGEARFRINTFYSRENLAAAFRLIPTKIRTIEELNLPPIYNQLANLKQGLVLVTGPTGHGKSTTLAAILQSINLNRSVHILTIEDPIEYIFPKSKAVVDQREMHDDTHSWTVALKSAMRQNPDVILVGEMRDFETISAAITLAETGHLVFATLHTNSAAQTIDRIIDVFPENQQAQIRTQLSSILEAVIAQRLIPIDGGGRRAVSEILIGTPAIKNLIREGKAHQMDNVIRTSSDVGMVSLESSLVKLVREGLITMDKAQEYAVHPEEVVRLLRG